MNQMTPIPASQQIKQLEQQLLQAFVQKHEAEAKLNEAEKAIVAIRNVLAGIPMGQQVQQEINAEVLRDKMASAQKMSPPPAPNAP